MTKLALWFTGNPPTLDRTCFSHHGVGEDIKAVRGKTPGAYRKLGTFQWTQAVQGMSILALRTAALAKYGCGAITVMEGYEGSPASSLDYAIGKLPVWMLDVFGADRFGLPLAKRLFRRTNPERKRSGPVSISFNENVLPPSQIEIFFDGNLVTDQEKLLQAAQLLENEFILKKNRVPDARMPEKRHDLTPSSADEEAYSSPAAQFSGDLICPCCGEKLEFPRAA